MTNELTAALKTLLTIAENQLDQSATHDGLTNADIIAKARKALRDADRADKITLDAERLPIVQEFLESLDGYGLIVTDDDLITERLADMGKAPFDLLQTFKPSEVGKNRK